MTGTEIILIVVITAAAGLIKSTTGMGYPLVLVPALALFMDVAEAVVIVAPSNLLLNVNQTWKLREQRPHALTLPRFLTGAVVGAIVGTALLPVLPDRGLRTIVMVVVVLFLVNRLSRWKFTVTEEQGQRLAPTVGFVAGLFQGAAGLSGPIVSPWFLSLNIARDAFIYAIGMSFGLSGLLQIVVLTLQGSYTWTLFALGVLLTPVALAVFPVGAALRSRISLEIFERIVLLLLAGSAISLFVKVL